MSWYQSRARFPRVFKREREAKRKTWYAEETATFSPPAEKHQIQKPAQTAPLCGGPSKHQPKAYFSQKFLKWVELCERDYLIACLEPCLRYEGLHENGFHLLTLTPRPFLEMKNNRNQPMYSLPLKSCTALEHFLRYIPEMIGSKVNNDPFVLVIRDIHCMSGCSEMCCYLVKTICQRLNERFGGRFKRVVIYRPVGLLALALTNPQCRNLPYSSYKLKYELVVADQFSHGKLAKATGFPGKLIQ